MSHLDGEGELQTRSLKMDTVWDSALDLPVVGSLSMGKWQSRVSDALSQCPDQLQWQDLIQAIDRTQQLEQEQLSRIKGFESWVWRWPPEVHLIHIGPTSVESEPIPIRYADEDSHFADRCLGDILEHWPIWMKPQQRLRSCAFALFEVSRLGFREFLLTLLKNQQEWLE
jgi:hypothetical protein